MLSFILTFLLFLVHGEVVLSEHFRCAPAIIDFSNKQFYDDRLVPLRLPTQSERLTPSLVDVKVIGTKVGKINEVEADKIVEMIQEHMNLPRSDARPRSIGVISLIGDEQSRLIRGRLLDAIGPEKMARHNILIGDAPTFQGAERDVVFLSMVCSRGSVPTQSQLMHFQRANVAMSRARDRCVLVRSIELTDISSMDDMKVPIIAYFMQGDFHEAASVDSMDEKGVRARQKIGNGSSILKQLLEQRGYTVTDMGVIWKHGICVENDTTRVALLVDGDEGSGQEWQASYGQQKAIERVGWKCFRVDSLSLFLNLDSTMKNIGRFLASANIEEPVVANVDAAVAYAAIENEDVDEADTEMLVEAMEGANVPIVLDDDEVVQDHNDHDVVTISSSDDGEADSKPAGRPDRIGSAFDFAEQEDANAARFGQVVELDFLRQMPTKEEDEGDEAMDDLANDASDRFSESNTNGNEGTGESTSDAKHSVARLPPPTTTSMDDFLSKSSSDESSVYSKGSSKGTKKSKYRRLDNYSKDGRYYPEKCKSEDVEWMYDTDSDLPKPKIKKEEEEHK
jgi:hypothetical protein